MGGQASARRVARASPPTGARSEVASPPIQAANWRVVQVDSVFIGIVTASGTFLPVFLLRLGAWGLIDFIRTVERQAASG